MNLEKRFEELLLDTIDFLKTGFREPRETFVEERPDAAAATGTEAEAGAVEGKHSPESGPKAAELSGEGPPGTGGYDSGIDEEIRSCTKCRLHERRRNAVPGAGSGSADIMFIGEGPGEQEDVQGLPFVGKAGQLLTKIIQTMGLSRETVYIANILKCRPDTPGQSAGNRKPTPEEMQTCIPYLHEQIDLIRPKVIVALGATAVEGLLGKTIGITRLRGQWRIYRGIPLMPTYHPAYLLRNQAPIEKRRVWEDMLQVMERLGMVISTKQRNYFVSSTR